MPAGRPARFGGKCDHSRNGTEREGYFCTPKKRRRKNAAIAEQAAGVL